MVRDIQLLDPKLIIRVQMWGAGQWRRKLYGTLIGTSDGVAGVLLDSGLYIDVPVERLKEIGRWTDG